MSQEKDSNSETMWLSIFSAINMIVNILLLFKIIILRTFIEWIGFDKNFYICTFVVSVCILLNYTPLYFDQSFVNKHFGWRLTLTHFSPMFHFYTLWKRQKNLSFSDVFRGIEMEQWANFKWFLTFIVCYSAGLFFGRG